MFAALFLCQRDHEKMKITREREEKLIVSAWYEMVSLYRRVYINSAYEENAT